MPGNNRVRSGIPPAASAAVFQHGIQQFGGPEGDALPIDRGDDVALTSAGKSVIYSGIATNLIDMGPEVWMPTTDEQYYERYKDDMVLQDAWYKGTGVGLVVPAYVDIDSIDELNAIAPRRIFRRV